jgi:hypothetical protein
MVDKLVLFDLFLWNRCMNNILDVQCPEVEIKNDKFLSVVR